jgi:hypothetical protein
MDRGERPFDARRRLAACLLLPVLAAGCGGGSNIQFSSGGPPQGGASNASTVNVQGHTTLGALIAAGILAGASIRRERERGLPLSMHAPEPDPSRRIIEQDCTKPIEDWSANLKCR